MNFKSFTFYLLLITLSCHCFSQEPAIKYYQRIYQNPFIGMCVDKLLMSTKGDTVNAIFYSRCETQKVGRSSNLTGKFVNKNVIENNIGNDKFKMEISQNKTIIKCYFGNDSKGKDLLLYPTKLRFESGLRYLRVSPDENSKAISQVDVKKTSTQLIEIGKLQKKDYTTYFWFKVRVNNLEGWILGGIDLSDF